MIFSPLLYAMPRWCSAQVYCLAPHLRLTKLSLAVCALLWVSSQAAFAAEDASERLGETAWGNDAMGAAATNVDDVTATAAVTNADDVATAAADDVLLVDVDDIDTVDAAHVTDILGAANAHASDISGDNASDASNDLAVIKTDTVVVSAARTAQQLLDANASMVVVKADSLKNLGRDSIPDMLRAAPSVRLVSDGTVGAKRIAVRGESATRTIIMVDGQRIDDQKNKSGAPLLINPFFTDRIEVVKGPASVLYGSEAMGGIVNVLSKKPVDRPFAFEGGLSYSGANHGITEYANMMGTVGDFHYAAGAFNTHAGDLYLADRHRLAHSSYESQGVNGDFSYDVLDNVTIGYTGEYFLSNAETTTTVNHDTYGDFRGEIPKWQRQKHKLYLEVSDLNDYLAAVNASIYWQSNDKDFNSQPQRGLSVDVANEQATWGGNLQLEFSLGDSFYLVTGYEGRLEQLDSESDISIAMGPMRGQFHVADSDYKQQSHALYALLSAYVTDELTLNVGGRYNYVKTEVGQSQITGAISVNEQTQPVHMALDYEDTTQSQFVGSLGLVYRPVEQGALRLNWSQGFRVPNIQEQFLLTATGTMQYGNPDLKPEKSDNYEIGFRWFDPQSGLDCDIAGFYTIADDYIETVNAGRFYTYRNIARAKSYGIELATSYQYRNWEPYLNLTWMEREYETASGSTKNTGTPRFSGNVGLRWGGQYVDVDLYADFSSRTRNDNLDGSSYFDSTEYGGYVVYNLSLSTKFGPNDAFMLYGSVDNILDRDYQTNELLHEAGRFFTIGLKGTF